MVYSDYKYVQLERKDGIATVTLNRPEHRNATVYEMRIELLDIFTRIPKDKEVKVVIFTGAGKAFSAGGDIRNSFLARFNKPVMERIPFNDHAARTLFNAMLELDQPIIAAVNGDAIGFGLSLALLCDIIIAAEDARLGDPHVKIGLVAADGVSILPLLVSMAKAKELLLTGDLLSAKEAERIGLINRVVLREELYPAVTELAQRIAALPQVAVRWTKLALNKRIKDHFNLTYDAAYALECLTFLSQDHEESVKAWLEKRPAHLTGL